MRRSRDQGSVLFIDAASVSIPEILLQVQLFGFPLKDNEDVTSSQETEVNNSCVSV